MYSGRRYAGTKGQSHNRHGVPFTKSPYAIDIGRQVSVIQVKRKGSSRNLESFA
jgi:hypothetical protein